MGMGGGSRSDIARFPVQRCTLDLLARTVVGV